MSVCMKQSNQTPHRMVTQNRCIMISATSLVIASAALFIGGRDNEFKKMFLLTSRTCFHMVTLSYTLRRLEVAVLAVMHDILRR